MSVFTTVWQLPPFFVSVCMCAHVAVMSERLVPTGEGWDINPQNNKINKA